MGDEGDELRVVMFPWLAFGHLIPFLELSKYLAEKGHRIFFVSTPRNIDRLPKIPPNLSARINLVRITLPRVENLPPNAEASSDIPLDKAQYLKMALDGLEEPFVRFLEDASPDWIIYDYCNYWVSRAAAKLRTKSAFFSTHNAAALAFIGPPRELLGGDTRTTLEHFTVTPNWIPFPSTMAYRSYELRKNFDESVSDPISGVTDTYRYGSSIQGCDFVAIRSYTEFEPEYIRLLEELYQKPVVPVGALPLSVQVSTVDGDEEPRWAKIFDWLDDQMQGSVVYVAFGSEVRLSSEEVQELAFGLELSKLPFVWVLKRELETLPEGFEARTKGCGAVCRGWVPQLKMLAHSSIGGFLTHSGWGSILEALQFGLALILMPMMHDQGLNTRLMVEKKIGVEVPRNEEDGSFTSDAVAKSLRLAMVEREGEWLRAKATEMREILADKDLHDRYVDRFVRFLKDHRHPPAVSQ
eukprot:TRINITY_DN21463_c0_g1_i1.p1 TRINITY_DN21463_c0_g1~~TRINITY_DN21463_c0_g1_i1.p1  ORF type:complete len:468 (-),score=46.41 TRINITY_DN21463_c0_g1_i1:80-1483(-)